LDLYIIFRISNKFYFAFVTQVFSQKNLQEVVENEQNENTQTVVKTERGMDVKVGHSPFLLRSGFWDKYFYCRQDGTAYQI